MMLGLDVGGTHTDVVVIDGKEVARKAKILTNQDNLLESVLFGMLKATAGPWRSSACFIPETSLRRRDP